MAAEPVAVVVVVQPVAVVAVVQPVAVASLAGFPATFGCKYPKLVIERIVALLFSSFFGCHRVLDPKISLDLTIVRVILRTF